MQLDITSQVPVEYTEVAVVQVHPYIAPAVCDVTRNERDKTITRRKIQGTRSADDRPLETVVPGKRQHIRRAEMFK